MDKDLEEALHHYAQTTAAEGLEAGKPLIEAGVKRWGPNFHKWTKAIDLMSRTIEILMDNEPWKQTEGNDGETKERPREDRGPGPENP